MFGRYPWTMGLVVWSILVWTTRINNIVSDDDLTGGGMAARIALSMSFTILAVLTVTAVRRESEWMRPLVVGFAAWTVLVWIVRGVQIALADHEAAFIAVHVVLAVVSIVLAAQALREQFHTRDVVPTGS